MKNLLLLLVAGVVLALCSASCSRRTSTDATRPLQQSFQNAEPEVKKAIVTVTATLKAGDYAQATKALAPVVTQRPLSEEQKRAVGLALKQLNEAVAANPALDSKELYDLRARMFKAVDSGPRF